VYTSGDNDAWETPRMRSGRVSVIIPTFNRAYCLPTALGSLQQQTYPDWEALVIDDGSKDDTAAVVQRLAAADPRIKYHHQQNGGVSAARNRGLDLSEGEWVAFLDSDDAWEPWKLGAQIACFRALPDIGMVWTDMNAVDAAGTLVSPNHLRKMYGAYRILREDELFQSSRRFAEIDPALARDFQQLAQAPVRAGDIYSSMIYGSLVHTSTVLLARHRLEKTGRFDTAYRTGEDYDFHLRTCRHGPVAMLDAPSILYRVAGGTDQLTAPAYIVEMARNALVTKERAIARDRARITLTDRQLHGILSEANRWVAEEHFKRGQFAMARPYYRRSIALGDHKLRHVIKAAVCHLPEPAVARIVPHLQRP